MSFQDFFNDYQIFKENYSGLRQQANIYRVDNVIFYINCLKEIADMQKLTFGKEISVLIMTDRLYGHAVGLNEYLQNSTDTTVYLVDTLTDAIKIVDKTKLDFLIIVGYLSNKRYYSVIQAVKETNESVSIVILATLDSLIDDECREYNIPYRFSKKRPMREFVDYLRQIKGLS